MYRYDAVKDYVGFLFRQLNVEFQPEQGCCVVSDDALVIWQEGRERYLFFLRQDLSVHRKNEAVGIELARIVLGHHALKPRSQEDRFAEAELRYIFAARLLIPRYVVKRALEEGWTAKQLAEEALVSKEMAAFRMLDYKVGQIAIPAPKGRFFHLAKYNAFFEAQLARPS